MAKIRPQRIVTPRIVLVEKRPGIWLWLLALFGVGLWTWQVYDYGLRHADIDSSEQVDETQGLRERIMELERERDELRFVAAKYERASQIDREAAQAIQGEIKILQNERDALRQEADSLRSLVAEGGDRVEVTDYALQKTAGQRRYRYLFTVTRDVEGAKKLEGWVTLWVNGESGGEAKELPLSELSGDGTDTHRLGFRHFQKIEGEVELPADFAAHTLTIEVRPLGTQFKPFTISYDWPADDA